MEPDDRLPSYAQPPLAEVAADVQFATLPVKAADIGTFHALIAADYPRSFDVPPLMPVFEIPGPDFVPPGPVSVGSGVLPRSWFISSDDEHVVQFQPDRLIVNWRMRPGGGAYPRYCEVRRRLVAAHESLTRLVHSKGYSDIVPNQCDLAYFNRVLLPEGAEWGDLHRLLRGVNLEIGPGYRCRFDDCQLVLRRALPGPSDRAFGRLRVECSPILIDMTQRGWALNVAVRGRPATGTFSAVLDFFDQAHGEIVRCFTAITTEAMHAQWGRQR